MRKVWMAACGLLLAARVLAQEAAPAAPAPAAPPAPTMVNVVMHTTLGDIHVALEQQRAPLTVANFLHYVDQKRYDGAIFYRAVKIGDDNLYGLVQGGVKGDPKRVFKPIAHESPLVTGVSHLDGAISMARDAPGTAASEFFFVIGDLTTLDGSKEGNDPGYAAFGHVTDGMPIVRGILQLPRDPNAGADNGMQGQMLLNPVKILTVRRAD